MSFLSFPTLPLLYLAIEAYDNNTEYQYFFAMYEHSMPAHKLLSHTICVHSRHVLEVKSDNVSRLI